MSTSTGTPLTLTPAASAKAARLADAAGLGEDWRLRVAVQPGGCSGLRYQVFFDDRDLDGDTAWVEETDEGALGVVVDRLSAPYLSGASMDYHDTIERQGFTIDNPNAAGTCACGDSFH